MGPNDRTARVSCALLAAVVVASVAKAQTVPDLKVAEGEYLMRVTMREGKFEVREGWALAQRSDGNYKVESTTQFRFDKERMLLRSIIHLSPGFRPAQWQMSGWVPGMPKKSGAMTLEFGDKAVHWKAGTEEVTQEVDAPYSFIGPMMPWFLTCLAEHSPRDVGQATSMRFVWMDDSFDKPIDLLVEEGSVEFLGTEQVKVAGRLWNASKYLVKPGALPSLVFWRSKEGVLLALQDAKKPEQRMELIRYKEYRALSPLR
jgi:hypothetical protein